MKFLAYTSTISGIVGYFIPYLFIVYIISSFIFFSIMLFDYKIKVNKFLYILFSLILLPFLFALMMPWNDVLYMFVIKDFLFAISSFLYMIAFYSYSDSWDNYKIFFYNVSKLIYFILLVCAIFSLYKYYLLSGGYKISILWTYYGLYPRGTSLIVDYNFYSSNMFLGLLIGYNYIKNNSKIYEIVFYIIGNSILLSSILLSGSRRSIVILFIIIFLYFINIVHKKQLLKFFLKKMVVKFFILIVIFMGIYIFSQYADISLILDQFHMIIERYKTISDIATSMHRFERWEYAGDMLNDRSCISLLIGNGFNYIHLFANKFAYISVEDYPHNIFISALLYGGIIAFFLLILYIILVIKITRVQIKYLDMMNMYCIYILITLFLGLTSGNSIFSIRGLLVTTIFVSVGYALRKDSCTISKGTKFE